nr:MAG TPA: TraL protein [Caudoviricetes sp.]
MTRIKLHLQACALFAPAIIGIICSTIIIMLLVLIYSIGLYRWSKTRNGRNFLRSYYREIMRLERML